MEGIFFPSSFPVLRLYSILVEIAFCTATFFVILKVLKYRSHPGLGKVEFPIPKINGNFRAALSHPGKGWIWERLHTDFLQIITGFSALNPNVDVIAIPVGFTQCILLNKAQPIEEFLMKKGSTARIRYELFSSWFGNSFTLSTAPGWKSRKKIVMPMVHNGTMHKNLPSFDEHCKTLIDVLKNTEEEDWVDVKNYMELYSMDSACEMAVGEHASAQLRKDSEYVAAMKRATRTVMKRIFNPFLSWDFLFWKTALGRQFKKDISYLRGFVQNAIQQRKAGKNEPKYRDLLSILLDTHLQDKDFTEDDMTDEIAGIIFGSQDRTAAGMSWTLYLVGLHPDVQRKMHEELDSIFGEDRDRPITSDDLGKLRYLECVLKESHRIYPPFPFNGRQLLEDFNICGRKIKKGSYVIISHYDLHRNPEAFPNPEKFDPDRFLPENSLRRNAFSYMPFSAGDRSCMGRRLAILTEKIAIGNILRHFSLKSLDQRDKLRISVDLVLHSIGPLRVKFTQRTANGN